MECLVALEDSSQKNCEARGGVFSSRYSSPPGLGPTVRSEVLADSKMTENRGQLPHWFWFLGLGTLTPARSARRAKGLLYTPENCRNPRGTRLAAIDIVKRRDFLRHAAVTGAVIATGCTVDGVAPNNNPGTGGGTGAGTGGGPNGPGIPALTPGECTVATNAQVEGPYYLNNPPVRNDISIGVVGVPLTVTGYVHSLNGSTCTPLENAEVDFWQADGNGVYYGVEGNNDDFLRGIVRTDATGLYRVQTIVPGLYPGRTQHIHVKVRQPNGRILTTQLYFPNQATNQQDGLYDQTGALDMEVNGDTARFDFIV